MISCSIKLSDVDKTRFFVSQKTGEKYLTFMIFENKQPDQFGKTHTIKEDLTREERENGREAKIIGNGKEIARKPAPVQQRAPVQTQRKPADPDLDADDSGDVCF